jgi:hypothetical protein
MFETDSQTSESPDIESPPYEPIMKATGSPISGRLILLVAGIVVAVIISTAVFAFSQGVFSSSGS